MKNNTEASAVSKSKQEFWQNHINQWQQSALSQQVYCDQQNIRYTTFGYWRTRLRREPRETKGKRFTPVQVRQAHQDSSLSVKVRLVSGTVISIPCDMGASSIAELIHMLEKAYA